MDATKLSAANKNKRKASRQHLVLFLMLILIVATVGCSGSKSTNTFNPAAERMGALAGIPADSDVPSNGILPNVAPMIEAGTLAGANTEAVNIKSAARLYLTEHPDSARLTSDNLWPSYINTQPKARYYLVPMNSLVTRVDLESGGWSNIVYSLSRQKWMVGTPDRDHENDQDIP